jgi:hypothetical protein
LSGSNPDAEKITHKAGSIDLVIEKSELNAYENDGFLVLADFVYVGECDALRERAEKLVRAFEPAGLISLFSTQSVLCRLR